MENYISFAEYVWNVGYIRKNKMEAISATLKDRFNKIKTTKKKGAVYLWQDEAVTYAKKLGVKLEPAWFRVFKITPKSILQRAFTYCSDSNHPNKKMLFYKMVGSYRNEQK
jgi:hypothetical protein